MNLKFIWDVVTRIRIGQKGKAYVVDSTGHLVADPDIGLVLRKTNLSALEQVQAAFAPGADDSLAMLAKDLNGHSVLTAYAPIEPAREQAARGAPASTLGWKVFVEQPVAEVYAALDATIVRTVALIVAGLLFSALAALYLARSMVRPIRTLQEGAQRIGAGDLESQIDVRTGDELEALAGQFNRMTAQLRESYTGLERKVEERTAELKQALEFQSASGEILRVISSSLTRSRCSTPSCATQLRLFDATFAAPSATTATAAAPGGHERDRRFAASRKARGIARSGPTAREDIWAGGSWPRRSDEHRRTRWRIPDTTGAQPPAGMAPDARRADVREASRIGVIIVAWNEPGRLRSDRRWSCSRPSRTRR